MNFCDVQGELPLAVGMNPVGALRMQHVARHVGAGLRAPSSLYASVSQACFPISSVAEPFPEPNAALQQEQQPMQRISNASSITEPFPEPHGSQYHERQQQHQHRHQQPVFQSQARPVQQSQLWPSQTIDEWYCNAVSMFRRLASSDSL